MIRSRDSRSPKRKPKISKAVPGVEAQQSAPSRSFARGSRSIRRIDDTTAVRQNAAKVAATGALDRRAPRHRVNLRVVYKTAQEFVTEYADNLSCGGLFVRGAHHLKKLEKIRVQVELPGFCVTEVEAQVVHVTTPELALETGGAPGAGVAITQCPPEFAEQLQTYLLRLGRRRDFLVLTTSRAYQQFFCDAGYHVERIAEPQELIVAAAKSERPLAGILVTRQEAQEFRVAARRAGVDELLFSLDFLEEARELLSELDQAL